MIIDGPGSSRGGESDCCGKLVTDLQDEDETQDLTVREACNKIVHAEKVRFDIEEDESFNDYITPTLYLYGKHKGKDWKATLLIVDFAKGVEQVVA